MNAPQLTTEARAEICCVEMIFPEQANHYGTLYGGNALALLGKIAFIAASRYTRRAVVMASSEAIAFEQPVRVGQLLELTGTVVRVGRSSLTVEVCGVAETLINGNRAVALRGRFEMVTVNADGNPVSINEIA